VLLTLLTLTPHSFSNNFNSQKDIAEWAQKRKYASAVVELSRPVVSAVCCDSASLDMRSAIAAWHVP
jgi:hypothetical protein